MVTDMVPTHGVVADDQIQQIPIREIRVAPVHLLIAGLILKRHHYLHSVPGGSFLAFGIFWQEYLLGAATFGAGPANVHRLVDGATPRDGVTLTRLWLSDVLPRNSESRAIGMLLRALRRNTDLKFLVSYADPKQGHLGIIYQATNWLYTGLSDAMPTYDLGDGIIRHSRSLSQIFGTRSRKHFASKGIDLQSIPQPAKHRYVFFLDRRWAGRLLVPILPYPRQKEAHGDS